MGLWSQLSTWSKVGVAFVGAVLVLVIVTAIVS